MALRVVDLDARLLLKISISLLRLPNHPSVWSDVLALLVNLIKWETEMGRIGELREDLEGKVNLEAINIISDLKLNKPQSIKKSNQIKSNQPGITIKLAFFAHSFRSFMLCFTTYFKHF